MSKAAFTFGRFNPPTEAGHGKLVSAVQSHAEDSGGKHYIFPSHTQDAAKNPLSHSEKAGAMKKLFPNANIVSQGKVRTAIDAMKHLESKGHTHVTMIVGSDRVKEFHTLLNKYRTKEFPGIKKVEVKSAGQRDPDAEGAEGMSASKLRGLVKAGKREEFISHYSNKELGAKIHDKVKQAMSEETKSPIGIFLLGGPGSGKDYVLKNIFNHFDLTEVQLDQVLNGKAEELLESNQNIVINGVADAEKIELVKNILEGYEFDTVCVSVSNKVSRVRNLERENPLSEDKRFEKWYRAEKLTEELDCFVFNNSINLNESSQMEQIMFGGQIEKLLERLVSLGLVLSEKEFAPVKKDKASGLPKKYVSGLSKSTALARKAHWKKMSKLSDSDPRAYEPAPGDKTAKTKPSKHTLAVRKMMDEAELPKKLRHVAKSGNITAVKERQKENRIEEGAADSSLAAKASKSGVSLSTLKKVYRRGVAAWNSGHRPGTTPSQWGHARVNSYINKGKTYHTADKDLREEVNNMFEAELLQCCPDMSEAVDMTPTLSTASKKRKSQVVPPKSRDAALDGLPVVTTGAYVRENAKSLKSFMPTPRQVPAPPGGHSVPPGYERVKSWGGAYELRKIREKPTTVKEAVEYHMENKISFTENVFRPGSEMFFEMIAEAKNLYKEGKYTPADKFEIDLLESDIGEIAEFEGQQVVLDYPIEEGLEECWTGYVQKGLKKKGNRMVPNCVPVNEEDKTDGKGIGKPWREGGGGAVYVRTGDGGVKKVRFSQSGMTKKFNDPGATKSFVARHHCLTNKDKTSASYWACRYPRFFSNSGKIWW
jgi:nicotinic acid mononucleotide adenylyltransferase